MTKEKNNIPRSQYNATSVPGSENIRKQAEQKTKDITFPDLDTMTHEEVLQMVYDMQVKQIEADLQIELLRSWLEEKDDKATLFSIVTKNMLDRVALTDMDGNFTFAGKAHEILGYEPGFLIGKNIMDFVHPEQLPYLLYEFNKLLASEEHRTIEYRFRCKDQSYIWFEMVGKVVNDENNNPWRIVFSARDITWLKSHDDERRDLIAHLLTLISTPGNFREIISALVASLQRCSGSEAVGIRMVEGEDFPYYETRGFPPEFIEAENHLCAYGPDGNILRNGQGNPVLECMCGNILSGSCDPSKPFFTNHGSFWTQSTSALLASTTIADRNGRTRNRCHGEGYESVVLIPLRTGDQVFGLLQFNDSRPGRFTREQIAYFESVADSMAAGLAQRQTEESLRESEEKFRHLFEKAEEGILVARGATLEFANPSLERILGHPMDKITSEPFINFIHPEDQAAVLDRHLRRMRGEQLGKSYHFRIVTPEGTVKWINIKNQIIEWEGAPANLGFVADITERKQAEEALRKSEERYRESEKRVREKLNAILLPEGDIGMLDLADILDTEAIQDLMNDFYSLTSIGGSIIDLDGNVLVSTGWQDICTRFHRVHRETCKNCIESDTIISSGIEPGQFKAYRCKNSMWDIATPIVIGDKHFGNIILGQFFYEDEEIGYDTFRAQAQKFGFDEQIYMEALDRVPQFSRKAVEMAMNYYSRLAEMISTLSYSNLKLARTLEEHKRNEQEREKLQSQLNQAQKMESVGRLAGGVAHDFNNKLAIINGYAEVAMERIDPSDPLHEMIQEIHTAGKQSAGIVRQLLAFARQQTISPVLLDLNDTIASMLKMLQRLIGENIDLEWHPGKNLWPVKIDPSQVDQIMANLAVNSRDAISDVGKLTIETKNTVVNEDYCKTNPEAIPGRYVMLAVSDDGFGIEKEVRDQLFEPFFTTKAIGKGTGLGLSTIYGILKQNKGFVNVYSEPGEGTTFKIYLPSHETEKFSLDSPGESSGEMPTGTESILVVEDEKAILQISKRMLEGLGYTVHTAGNPSEAMQFSEAYNGTIDLLITDVIMPEMNGRDLSSRLIQIHPGLKTLYMSGYTANVIAHHGVLDEGVQFIQKPFSLRDLAVKVREVIEQAVLSTEAPDIVGRG